MAFSSIKSHSLLAITQITSATLRSIVPVVIIDFGEFESIEKLTQVMEAEVEFVAYAV